MTGPSLIRGLAALGAAVAALILGAAIGYSQLGTAVLASFVGALTLGIWEDLRTRRIPNWLTYTGAVSALIVSALDAFSTLRLAAMGLLLAGGVMFVLWALGRGRMGLGDVKLAAFAGAVLGPAAVPSFLVVSSALGGVAALSVIIAGRGMHSTLAYGPYLGAGALVALFHVGGPVVR